MKNKQYMNIDAVRADLDLAEHELLARLAADNALEWDDYVKYLLSDLELVAKRLEVKDEDL